MFERKMLSIDIGSQYIKIALGNWRKSSVYIDKLIMTETPLHCIEDGNIIDNEKLSLAIREVLEMGNVKIKSTHFTTNSTDIINREIIVPEAEEDELDTLVQFEIRQYLPIIIDDYIIQHNVLEQVKEETTENSINKLRMLVVTYPRRIAEEYLKLAEELKLKPEVLDVNFNAVSKLFQNGVEINSEIYSAGKITPDIEIGEYNISPVNKYFIGETIAAIDMGAEKISVNIFCGGKMDFSRNIASGGIDIDRNITRHFDINLDEAEKRKKEFCDLINEKGAEHMIEINEIIKETVDKWIDEIGRVFQFYRNKKVGNRIDKVFIYGGTSRLKGLSSYMERNLNNPDFP